MRITEVVNSWRIAEVGPALIAARGAHIIGRLRLGQMYATLEQRLRIVRIYRDGGALGKIFTVRQPSPHQHFNLSFRPAKPLSQPVTRLRRWGRLRSVAQETQQHSRSHLAVGSRPLQQLQAMLQVTRTSQSVNLQIAEAEQRL